MRASALEGPLAEVSIRNFSDGASSIVVKLGLGGFKNQNVCSKITPLFLKLKNKVCRSKNFENRLIRS